jgi:hypothetical protein
MPNRVAKLSVGHYNDDICVGACVCFVGADAETGRGMSRRVAVQHGAVPAALTLPARDRVQRSALDSPPGSAADTPDLRAFPLLLSAH